MWTAPNYLEDFIRSQRHISVVYMFNLTTMADEESGSTDQFVCKNEELAPFRRRHRSLQSKESSTDPYA